MPRAFFEKPNQTAQLIDSMDFFASIFIFSGSRIIVKTFTDEREHQDTIERLGRGHDLTGGNGLPYVSVSGREDAILTGGACDDDADEFDALVNGAAQPLGGIPA
jgi:hypothetical protein